MNVNVTEKMLTLSYIYQKCEIEEIVFDSMSPERLVNSRKERFCKWDS